MLFPKLQNPKPKLTLAQKFTIKIQEPSMQNIERKEEKQPSFRNSRIISESKHQNRRLSSTSLRESQPSRNSFKTRKLSSNQKEIEETAKLYQNDIKIQHKSTLKLNRCIKSSHFSSGMPKHQESTETAPKIKQMRKTLLLNYQDRTERKSSHTNTTSSHQMSQEILKNVQNLFPMQEQNFVNNTRSVDNQMEMQNQFEFQNQQNINIEMTKSDGPWRDEKYQKTSEMHKNFNRKISIESFSLQSSLFSIKIEPKNDANYQKKLLMVKNFIEDENFEWQYQKFKEYTQKYSEYEVKLKQNFAMLQLLTENIELLKERIIPYRDYTALKEIIEIVKPSLTKKQQKAIDIKMSMVQWKKRFFSNIRKIKEKIINSWQQRSQRLRFKLEDNEELSQKTFNIINQVTKKETAALSQENIIKIKNYSEMILLNQKQMIDDVQIFETNNESFLQKIDLMEEQWTRAFDIFNFTLEKCAKKSITLSQTIEKFYGICSTAAFLTKGIEAEKFKDQKLLQNDECNICRWNKVKIQKIIEQNSLAKDHLVALKHLVIQ